MRWSCSPQKNCLKLGDKAQRNPHILQVPAGRMRLADRSLPSHAVQYTISTLHPI